MPNFNIPSSAVEWLASGERGISSEFMFYVFTGIPAGKNRDAWRNHPSDPDDFKRCEKLLRPVPEFRDRLDEMRVVSSVWDKLVSNWSDIVTVLEEEAPGVLSGERKHGCAPKAYTMMKELGC